MVDVLLTAERVVRRYAGRTVLDVDALELRSGEILAVVGPNGAGKSTLFRLLLQLERPDSGTIRLLGEAIRPGGRYRGRLAGVFQRPILFTGTVRSNVAYGLESLRLDRRTRTRRVEAALGWLELHDLADVSVHTLSGGEAQRVALARAVALEPDVLLLDEPASALDVTVRRRFRADLQRVARQHARGIILITHDAADAFGLADRVAVLHHGRVVQSGTPEAVMLRPSTPFIAELSGAELLLRGVIEDTDDNVCTVRVAPELVLTAVRDTEPAASAPRAGDGVVVAYRPEDIVLAADSGSATSATNRFGVTVAALEPAGAFVRVLLRCDAAEDTQLTALLTRRSVDALGVRPGSRALAQLNASALKAWRRDAPR